MLKPFMIYVILNVRCVNTVESTSINFDTISECIIKVCYNNLGFRSTVILKYESYQRNYENLFFNTILETLSANNIQQIVFNKIEEINEVILEEEADWLIVVFMNQCELNQSLDFKTILVNIKYLIVVSDLLENGCRDYLDKIKNDVAKYDITFMFKESYINQYKFITFIPQVDEKTCLEFVKEPVEINTCINGYINPGTVFPLKTPKNLHKCPLSIGIGPLFPFAMIRNKERFKTFDKLDETDVTGLDFAITKIIVKQFNASYILHYVEKKEENPIGQYDFIPFIVNGSLDICAGGFYRIYQDVVAYSGVYASQSVIWMYTADRKERSWSNLITKVNGLYIFITFYLCYSCIWYLICKFDDRAVSIKNTLLYSWGTLVGANGLPNASGIKQMILNLSYLVMCIHLSAYISIECYSYFTILEPPKLLLSNHDVTKSGRTPYLVPVSKYFVLDEYYVRFANTSKECYSFLDCFNKCLYNKGITVILQGVFLNFQAKTSVDGEAKVLRAAENLLTVYYEMLIRKGSPYVGRFQKILQRLFEGGIPERLYTEALGFNVIGKAKSASDSMMSISYSCQTGCQITLEQMAGVFYVWLVGCVVSSCVFILEIVLKKKSM